MGKGETADRRIGARLRKVRNALGLSMEDVSERIGFNNYQVLSNIEKGERPIRVAELAKLCKVYSKDLGFFLQIEEPSFERPVFAWREKSEKVSSTEIEERVYHLLTNYQMLEDLTGEKRRADVPTCEGISASTNFDQVEVLAEELRSELGLGDRPSACLVDRLEEAFNIKILHLDMHNAASATTTQGHFGFAIVVDCNQAPWRRNFSIAHELFHILSRNQFPLSELHQIKSEKKPREEQLADVFAAALLLPKGPVLKELDKRINEGRIYWTDIVRIAQDFGISTQALVWRLVNLNKLDREMAKKLLESAEFSTTNTTERAGKNVCAHQYSPRFVWLGLKAMKLGKISKGKFCEIFDIARAGFNEFIGMRGDLELFQDDTDVEFTIT